MTFHRTGSVQLPERLNPGGAEAVRRAVEHDGLLATDELTLRLLKDGLNLPVMGLVGLLVFEIDSETVDEWLDT